MSRRCAPPRVTDRDFGRRLYASDKGYTEQMHEVTDKAMLDIAPFHLSELKKPYLSKGYEEMEHMYSPMGGPVIPVRPPVTEDPESRTFESKMKWKTEPPDEGEPEHWYLVEVWNRVRTSTTMQGSKVTKRKRTYYPAYFSMKNVAAGTKGFKLEVWLPNITYSVNPFYNSDGVRETRVDGYDMGRTYRWFDVKEDAAWIKMIFTYMQSQGDLKNVTTARLTLAADADGEVEIIATDGFTELKERVKVTTIKFGIRATYSGTEYWIIFDRNLKLIEVAPYSDYIGNSYGFSDGIFTTVNQDSTPNSQGGIKKNGSWFRGPYVCNVSSPPDQYFKGFGLSINGHSLFTYAVWTTPPTEPWFIHTLVVEDVDYPVFPYSPSSVNTGAYLYSDFITLISAHYNQASDITMYILRTMSSEGIYTTNDLSSSARFDVFNGWYLTFGGIEYKTHNQFNGWLQRVTKI